MWTGERFRHAVAGTSARGKAPERFLDSLAVVPNEALRGFHVHYRHGVPSLDNLIPWTEVFNRIRQIPAVLIKPEIHHRKGIPAAMEFCRLLWKAGEAEAANAD